MKIGALIVTTGLPRCSGVAALLPEVGGICAGQRMISVLQCAGVSLTGLVVGPEEKKAERPFSQNGVVFLRCEKDTAFLAGVQEGLRFMRGKCDRVFVVPGDMPLFLPETLRALQSSSEPVAVPVSGHITGFPILLDKAAMDAVLSAEAGESLESTVRHCRLAKEYVPVSDELLPVKWTVK